MSNSPVKHGIFRRIFILYTLILFLAIVVIELFITDTVRESYIKDLHNNLTVQARLISDSISFKTPSPLDDLCKQFKETTGARVTIIAPDGRVLGDSETDSTRMDNHAHRQEIQQAALDGAGMSVRFSDTLKYDFLYVAIKVAREAGPEGFIRLSMPLKNVDAAINLLRVKIILVVTLILLATGVVSLWQIERIRRLTQQIRDFSKALARGEVGKKLFLERAGEFDEIAESLNAMSGELKNSIATHEEEQHRLNTVLRNIPDALFIIDANNTVRLSSLAARKLFGDTALQGRPFIEVVRNSEFLSLMEEVRKQRKTGVAEVKLDSPLEQYCVVQVSPLFYSERELSGFVAIFHDITQLKRLEETRKDFVANISHELKTPITAITGFAETLLEGALNDREHAVTFLRTIKANSERINSLIDDLMTISRIELGVIKVEKSPVDLQEVADHVLILLRNKAAEKNLTIQAQILPMPRTVAADRDRLIQILTNLVDNAIKFTEQGGVKFGMAEENGTAYLFVEDTGIGIPQKHLSRIGERFYRVDPGRSRSMGGTGLGLAIVKHLVKAHGWDMQIESTPGKGTNVRIFIT
ncbi:MAG TPA: ATP-binding protein [Nitrospirota bacterium]|nr:ATP-binding protein [Nitrospirota bacterium]